MIGCCEVRTQVPLSEAPVTTASKVSPIRFWSSSAAADLRTWRSTLLAASSCCVQWRGERGELGVRIGRGLPREGRLHQPLGDQVGIAAVRRRGVGVVLDREPEVARRVAVRRIEHVLAAAPAASPPTARGRRSPPDPPGGAARGTRSGRARRAPRGASRGRCSRGRRSAASAPACAPRGGSRGGRARSRKRAVTPLAAIMKSSISCLARFVPLLLEVGHLAVDDDRAATPGSRGRGRPARGAGGGGGAAASSCSFTWSAIPATAAIRGGIGAVAVEPGGDGVVGELGAVVDAGVVDVRGGDRAVGGDRHLDHDRQPVLALVERGDAGRQPLGEHREGADAGVDRGGVQPRVGVDRPSRAAPDLRRRRWRRAPGCRRRAAPRRPRAGRGRGCRRCRSTTRGGRAGRGSGRRRSPLRRPGRAPPPRLGRRAGNRARGHGRVMARRAMAKRS